MITTIRPVTICHAAKFSYYWLYSHPCDFSFYSWNSVPLNLPHLLFILPHPSILGATCSFSVSIHLFCFIVFICPDFSIPRISEIIQYLSFSVWLISLSFLQYFLGPSMLTQKKRAHYFYDWLIFHIGEGNGTPLQYSAWKIPWKEEPGGLWSMGSQRVRHDWSDLAAAAAIFHIVCVYHIFFIHSPMNGHRLLPYLGYCE